MQFFAARVVVVVAQVCIGGSYRQVESKHLPVRGEEGEGWTRRVDGG